jgi:hypothetical protein
MEMCDASLPVDFIEIAIEQALDIPGTQVGLFVEG